MNEMEGKSTATKSTTSTATGISSDATAPMSMAVVTSIAEPCSTSKNIFVTLPTELLRRIVYFLHPTDALSFVASNVVARRINVSALRPISRQGLHINANQFLGDNPQPYEPRIKLPCHISNIHSITLRLRWKDQGWGNRKGELFIIATSTANYPVGNVAAPVAMDVVENEVVAAPVEVPFDGGRVVARTDECAPHEWENTELTFCPIDGEYYHLWFRVGSDGGHVLSLSNIEFQTYIFDDAQSTYSKTFDCLYNLGCVNSVSAEAPSRSTRLPRWTQITSHLASQIRFRTRESTDASDLFYPKMLLSLCQSLQRSIEKASNSDNASPDNSPDPTFAFLSEYGIPIDGYSLSVVQDVIQTDIDERNIDWKLYEENCRNLRQRLNLNETNHPTGNDNRAAQRGIPIGLHHAAMNGFRVVLPRMPRGAEVANNNNNEDEPNNNDVQIGADIRFEPMVPPQQGNNPMQDGDDAARPQVVNNPDGTFTINLGNFDDLAAGAIPIHFDDDDNMMPNNNDDDNNHRRRGMGMDPPDANHPENEAMFGIARAAMAAAFGFETEDNDNNNNNNNRDGDFPQQRGGFQNFFQQINGGAVRGGIFVGGGNNNNNNMPFGAGFPFQNIIDLTNNAQRPPPAPAAEAVNDQTMTDNDDDDDDDDAEEVPIM